MNARFRIFLMVIPVLLVALAACGGEEQNETPTSTAQTISESEDTNRPSFDPSQISATPTEPLPVDAASFDSDGDGYFTTNELYSAMEVTASEYKWPTNYVPDFTPPSEPGVVDGQPTEQKFEVGYQYTVVNGYFICGWFQTFLDATQNEDTELAQQSLDVVINAIPDLPGMGEGSGTWYRDIAGRAQLGDISQIVQHVEVNCQHQVWQEAGAFIPSSTAHARCARAGWTTCHDV